MGNCCCGRSPEEKREDEKLEKAHLRALADSQAKGDQKGMALNYEQLGVLYLNRKEPDKAEQMLIKALEISQKINWRVRIARSHFSLGNAHLFQGKYDKAEDAFLKASAIFKEIGDEDSLKSIFYNLGSTYLSKGNLDKAEEMYLKYLKENKKGPQIYLELSKIYRKKNDKEKEKECLQKAVDILKDNGPKELMEKIKKRIADLGL